ncbi:MAG: undecaprenyldiphospho-muramoylpentapeptide beta-N-acetylglucosaminyltransferase [Candidatus Omnitrophota bacterium]
MKVLICAAGSGGHIYPALSLAQHLQDSNENAQILFLSSKKALIQSMFEKKPYQVFTVDFISPFRRKGLNPFKFFLKNLGFLLKFNIEAIKVFFLILRSKPDAVVGFGGIISIAAIIFARLQGIPTLIHEQNIIPGLANKFISRVATKVAIGFKKSKQYFTRDVVFTGNPIRPGMEKIDKSVACDILGLQKDKFTIFVFGGSQGSKFINKNFIQAITKLSRNSQDNLQIIHISGAKDISEITAFYQNLNINAKVFSYCANMSVVYSAADLVIGRSGAGTINEVCFFGKPTIFIPYPYAGGHQKVNAEFMREHGAACLLLENNQAVNHLQQAISRLIEKKDILRAMGQKSSELFIPGAGAKLADLVCEMIKA